MPPGGAIAEWSLEGCGDFCARWPDVDRVIRDLGYELHWVVDDPENGPARLEDHLRTLAVLDQLVPDEISETWMAISDEYPALGRQLERAEFDYERLDELYRAEAVDWARSTPYVSARIDMGEDTGFYVRMFEAWQAGASQLPEWVYEERWPGPGGVRPRADRRNSRGDRSGRSQYVRDDRAVRT